jgi:hypothetical protein
LISVSTKGRIEKISDALIEVHEVIIKFIVGKLSAAPKRISISSRVIWYMNRPIKKKIGLTYNAGLSGAGNYGGIVAT